MIEEQRRFGSCENWSRLLLELLLVRWGMVDGSDKVACISMQHIQHAPSRYQPSRPFRCALVLHFETQLWNQLSPPSMAAVLQKFIHLIFGSLSICYWLLNMESFQRFLLMVVTSFLFLFFQGLICEGFVSLALIVFRP